VLILQLIIITLLLLIFTEDMQSRSVHWFFFPLLALALIAYRYLTLTASFSDLFKSVSLNLAFLVVQLAVVSAYFSIKHKRIIDITSGLLGWGDILFVTCIAFYLAVLPFILFYITSLIVVLSFWLVYQSISKKKNQAIPLAGLQAILFAVLLTTSFLKPEINLTSDDQLLKLISL
jgi:hypothetical protein